MTVCLRETGQVFAWRHDMLMMLGFRFVDIGGVKAVILNWPDRREGHYEFRAAAFRILKGYRTAVCFG